MTLTIPPISALLVQPEGSIPEAPPPARPDGEARSDLVPTTSSRRRSPAPRAVVTFAALAASDGSWRRIATDDSAPYRAFLDPNRYPRGGSLTVVAVARALDGSTAVSKVSTFSPNG